MTSLQKKLAVALSAGSLLVNTVLPVFADISIELSGNGYNSDNTADVSYDTSTTVVQSNTADITNKVNASADTGNNSADRNTGGDVSVSTGDATTGVGVSNSVNSNKAEVNGCCDVDADVLISGNGDSSDNDAKLDFSNSIAVFQDNTAKLKNDVDAHSETGSNSADRNTGGSVSIETGDAQTEVLISNEANANWARIGGQSDGSHVSLRILGNGFNSDNTIDLDLDRSLTLVQSNLAKLSNRVDASAQTGRNSADRNTGGDVDIETGDAETGVGIDNWVNFNAADVDCGCILDVLAKIAGNGDSSDNDIKAKITDSRSFFQDNAWVCGKKHRDHREWGNEGLGLDLVEWPWLKHAKKDCNDVDAHSETGNNTTDRNTGDPDGDPGIQTGDAATFVDVENSGNSNVLGEAPDFDLELPWPGFDWDLSLSFDLGDLLEALLG